MEKRNQEYCKADAIAGLAVLVNSGADHVSDDYGLLESLASDTLSPNEARRFAEHLKSCEECRQECAAMWATGFYDDSPFGDRMRAFENDPISETDEHWKTIAVAFNEELVSAAKRSVASFDESVADDLYVAPEFKQALAVWEASKPKARPKAEPRRAAAKWRAFSYSAAAVLLGLVAVQFLETKPPVGPVDPLARHTTDDEPAEHSPATPTPGASDTARARALGGVPENASTSENINEADVSSMIQGARTKGGDGFQRRAKGGASIALPQYECLERNNEHFTAFDRASAIYQEGVEAFDKGDYSKASQKFRELVEELLDKTKPAEGKEDVLNAALFYAYWNYGVATAKNNDKEGAVKIFNELKTKKLAPNDKQEGFVEAALEAWGE